ncbi:hypothetical protein [Bifidobacterium pseudolongum]|uniref:hypothetical protein n=1 Tax=Bifidobacterium pseudolongum TaxID=1694 RepID=UPI00101FFFD0|nr:hypothetical protein [Bifidobacterium pseudolongum]RYQ42264.1 hypothetical protein PG1805B_1097 [Bifidobacterium pseudolongum subsp. globosum]
MTTRMSMRERREKIERLVQQDPRVQACAHTFDEAQAVISQWHANNDALTATKGTLTELAELITYSEFCLEDLKCAKRRAYNQLMNWYPRVWDTTCPDPFTTDTQTEKEPLAETEEMATTPADNDAVVVISSDKIMEIIDREEAAYKVTLTFYDAWGLPAEPLRERFQAVQDIRTQFQQLIDQAKEDTNA